MRRERDLAVFHIYTEMSKTLFEIEIERNLTLSDTDVYRNDINIAFMLK